MEKVGPTVLLLPARKFVSQFSFLGWVPDEKMGLIFLWDCIHWVARLCEKMCLSVLTVLKTKSFTSGSDLIRKMAIEASYLLWISVRCETRSNS